VIPGGGRSAPEFPLKTTGRSRRCGRHLLFTAGRLTNPDRVSRWLLHRLNQLPDVAEFTAR